MKWFRLYSEVLNDPKVQTLTPTLFKSWVNLLCYVAESNSSIFDTKSAAFALRISFKKMDEQISCLVAAGLIDATETGYTPHSWEKRQYKSDVSTDRVKRFRSVSRAVSETPPDTDTDTDTDTETERVDSPPPVKASTWDDSVKPPENFGNPPETFRPEKEEGKGKRKKERNIYTATFEQFWALVPADQKKQGKGSIVKHYTAAEKEVGSDVLVLKYGDYLKSTESTDDKKFRFWPRRWLSERHWEDEPIVAKPKPFQPF